MNDRSGGKAAYIPGTPAYETRLLHEAMQDAKRTAADLRAAAEELRRTAADARQARTDLQTLVEQINKEVSEAPETISIKLQPVIEGIVDRLLAVGDKFKGVMEERWQELLDHEVKVLGITDKAELIDIIARKIVLEVVEASKRIAKSRDQESEAINALTGMLPDIAGILDLERQSERPVPPAAKIKNGGSRGHSRNQHRRRR